MSIKNNRESHSLTHSLLTTNTLISQTPTHTSHTHTTRTLTRTRTLQRIRRHRHVHTSAHVTQTDAHISPNARAHEHTTHAQTPISRNSHKPHTNLTQHVPHTHSTHTHRIL